MHRLAGGEHPARPGNAGRRRADLPAAEIAGPAAKPNIIFLLTDDQRDNTLGAMGHPFVKTPHLDRLMRDSVRFRSACIAEPVCAPSGVSLFTGMHQRRTPPATEG